MTATPTVIPAPTISGLATAETDRELFAQLVMADTSDVFADVGCLMFARMSDSAHHSLLYQTS